MRRPKQTIPSDGSHTFSVAAAWITREKKSSMSMQMQ